MKTGFRFQLIIYIILIPAALAALDYTAINLDIMDLEKAWAPYWIDNRILFSYKTAQPANYVAVRFEHENYKHLHLFDKNQYDVFILLYAVPGGLERLKYRMVVDGIWMNDPFNPETVQDEQGIVFSILDLGPNPAEKPVSPGITPEGVTFSLEYPAGSIVYLAGDFNDWDPYMHRLSEVKPGKYSLSLGLTPGRHYYYFWIDSYQYTDPMNPDVRVNVYGQAVSTFVVP